MNVSMRFLLISSLAASTTGVARNNPHHDPYRHRGIVRCVEGTRCDSVWPSGGCREFTRYHVCGVACATGRSCGSRWFDSTCRDWNIDAACGATCSSEQICDVRWSDGTCRDYAVKVSCAPW